MTTWQGKVSRDGFTYDGRSFYVEVDNHRHPRASPASLHTLLTYIDPGPLLTKKGTVAKRQPKPHTDSPSHYYQAQCVHYGLIGYKQRPAAKKHLLAAFESGNGTIVVPERIRVLEKEMRAEYDAANAVAQQKMMEEQAAEQKKLAAARRDWEKYQQAERLRERKEAEGMVKEFAAAGIRIQLGRINGTDSDNEALPVKDTQLRKDIAGLSEMQLRAVVEKLVFNKKTKTKSLKKAMAKEMRELAKADAARAQEAVNGDGKNPTRLGHLPTKDDEGMYNIMAPYLRDQWRHATDKMSLKMSISDGKSHFWVWFHFGIVSGIMRSRSAPPTHVGDKVHFGWRGREEGEGETTCGEENTASITFLGEGRIRGRMRWNGELFEFVGNKVPIGEANWSSMVQEWKDEYRGINERMYFRAGQGRWGGYYGGHEANELSSNSDTAYDEDESQSDDDDEGYVPHIFC